MNRATMDKEKKAKREKLENEMQDVLLNIRKRYGAEGVVLFVAFDEGMYGKPDGLVNRRSGGTGILMPNELRAQIPSLFEGMAATMRQELKKDGIEEIMPENHKSDAVSSEVLQVPVEQ